jgi:hypothetical protein
MLLLVDARKGILAGLLIRPIIDACWPLKYQIMGIRPPELISAVFPILVFIRLLASPGRCFRESPLSMLWIFYMFYQLFSAVMILTAGGGLISSVDFLLRVFNGFVAYFMLQEFFNRKEDFNKLLLVLLVASITPLGMSFYMNVMGGTLNLEPTSGGLVRNIGLYHDAFTIRLYSFQTIVAAFLYWQYFAAGGNFFAKAALVGILAMSALTIYKVHSKAGYMIAASWLFLYSLFNKKAVLVVGFLLIPLVLYGSFGFFDKIKLTYEAEVHVMEGKGAEERTFAGRWAGWNRMWNKWVNAPIHLQLIGDSASNTGVHSDFLRALFGTGILGFLLYIALLGTIGIRAIGNMLRQKTALNLVAVMIFAMWIVDAIGLVPGAYPSYQWFAWGFIGLAFRGVQGIDDSRPVTAGTG